MNSKLSAVSVAVSIAALTVAALALARSSEPPLRSDDPAPRVAQNGVAALATRVAELEAAERASALGGRLDNLERRVEELAGALASDRTIAPASGLPPVAAPIPEGEPSAQEIERFVLLQEAAKHRRAQRSLESSIDEVLARAGIDLPDAQRARLVDAYKEFQARRSEVWSEARARHPSGADWGRIIAETGEQLQREFAERIASFVPAGQAEGLSRRLLPIKGY